MGEEKKPHRQRARDAVWPAHRSNTSPPGQHRLAHGCDDRASAKGL